MMRLNAESRTLDRIRVISQAFMREQSNTHKEEVKIPESTRGSVLKMFATAS